MRCRLLCWLENADSLMLFIWDVNGNALSRMPRMAPNLRNTEELSIQMEKLSGFVNVVLTLMRKTFVLALINFTKLLRTMNLVPVDKRRKKGARVEVGIWLYPWKNRNEYWIYGMWSSGVNEKMSRRGPRTEPWGTLVVTGVGLDCNVYLWMNWVWLERYDLSRSRDELLMTMEASLSRMMLWKIVSTAALRSRRMRMDSSLKSAVVKRLLVIFTKAVSVL